MRVSRRSSRGRARARRAESSRAKRAGQHGQSAAAASVVGRSTSRRRPAEEKSSRQGCVEKYRARAIEPLPHAAILCRSSIFGRPGIRLDNLPEAVVRGEVKGATGDGSERRIGTMPRDSRQHPAGSFTGGRQPTRRLAAQCRTAISPFTVRPDAKLFKPIRFEVPRLCLA